MCCKPTDSDKMPSNINPTFLTMLFLFHVRLAEVSCANLLAVCAIQLFIGIKHAHKCIVNLFRYKNTLLIMRDYLFNKIHIDRLRNFNQLFNAHSSDNNNN